MNFIAALPWNFAIVVTLITLHQTGTPIDGIVQNGLFILYTCALVFGIINSSNISHHNFTLLIIRSMTSVAVASSFISYLVWGIDQEFPFIYGVGLAFVMINATVSPINSFKMALRDFHVPEQ